MPRRGDPRDALVGAALDDLPEGAVVATGSIRRRAQLADLRPDLRFAELRGNMATRLAKAEHFDAIVVAAAALGRLGLEQHLTEVLPVERFIPQVAQGALVVECRAGEPELAALLQELEDATTRRAVDAERAFLAELGGDCTLPAGAHARVLDDGGLELRAVLAADVRGAVARTVERGDDPVDLGTRVARTLRAQLADR